MTSLTISCQGKRYTARITPMQPLVVLVEQVAGKLKPAAAPSDCTLLADGKPVDLSTPFRLANLPVSARLELTTGQPSSLGIQSRLADPSGELAARPAAAQQDAAGPSSTQSAPPPPPPIAGPSQAAAERSGEPPAQPSSAGRHPPPPAQAALGLEREVAVFTRAELEASAPATSDAELPDSFYEFGVEDYARVMQGYSAAKARAEAGLRTGRMREEEAAARARRFPVTRLRILFPDGLALQMQFESTDRLADVRRSLAPCLAPQAASGNWHLFVTPPKKVLTDEAATLFQAGLCPAANLYFGGAQPQSGPFLRPEVAALRGGLPATPQPAAAPPAVAEPAPPGEAPVAAPAGKEEEGGRKVPKWMKLGKK